MRGRPLHGSPAMVKSLEVLYFSLLEFQPLPLIALVVLVFSGLGWVTGWHMCTHMAGCQSVLSLSPYISTERPSESQRHHLHL